MCFGHQKIERTREKNNIDILALRETRVPVDVVKKHGGYTFCFSTFLTFEQGPLQGITSDQDKKRVRNVNPDRFQDTKCELHTPKQNESIEGLQYAEVMYADPALSLAGTLTLSTNFCMRFMRNRKQTLFG